MHSAGLNAIGLLMVSAGVLLHSQSATNRPAQDPPTRAQLSDALRTGGLQGAAALTGSYRGRVGYPKGGGPATLKELAELSSLVIVGAAEGNVCQLAERGQMIVTVYSVRPQSVLKGSAHTEQASELIDVAILGGRVTFPDGSWAHLTTENFALPTNGERAVWFLRSAPSQTLAANAHRTGRDLWVPAAGPLGFYDLTRTGRRSPYVLPAGSYENPLARLVHKMKLLPEEFIQEVQASTR